MKSLKDIFDTTEKHVVKWSSYFDIYERHLKKFTNKNPKILEIGINDGGSTEMWLEYFGVGTEIINVDIDQRCESYTYSGNVKTIIGDQGSDKFWEDTLKQYDSFDIILDDGGHTMQQQLTTLKHTFPKLNNGGIFLIEDTHTSYWSDWGGNFREPSTLIENTKQLVDLLSIQHFDVNLIDNSIRNIYENLYMICYYNSIVILEKRITLQSISTHNK